MLRRLLGSSSQAVERRRLVIRLAMTSAAAATMFPRDAQAQETYTLRAGIGVFVGYNFGPREGVEWGFEGYVGRSTEYAPWCDGSTQPQSVLGGGAQVGLIGLKDPRVTGLVFGGKELSPTGPSFTGEMGATYRFGSDPGPGIHFGISPAWTFFDAYLRAQLLLDDYSVGAGARMMPFFSPGIGCAISGRSLRTDEGLATVTSRVRRARSAANPLLEKDPRRQLAGRAWERDAQYECASVPAFLDLAEALLACDAPFELVERALDAACDEIAHARLCARLASRYQGENVHPALPPAARRRPLGGRPGVARLAVESWIDGCLGEGAAAHQAARASKLAVDRAAQEVLRRIAVDESRHAELGWAVLRWALQCGGADVREAVRSHRDVELLQASTADAERSIEYGRLSADEVNAVTEQNSIESRHRLDAILSSSYNPASIDAPQIRKRSR
jgi:hypothetical protein